MLPYLINVLLLICLLLPSSSQAAENELNLSDQPVEVSADRLDATESTGTLVFSGNAQAKQGDVTIYADQLTLHYSADNKEIERVNADGHVRIVQGDRVATGEHGVFYRLESRVVLRGQPRVKEADNFVEGHEITVLLNERRSIVTAGEGSRVNAVFQPQSENKP